MSDSTTANTLSAQPDHKHRANSKVSSNSEFAVLKRDSIDATIQLGGKQQPAVAKSSMDKKNIGHREVKDGVVHYKKVPTDELKKSIQFGIVHSISFSNKYIDRDLLIQDFQVVETIVFPKAGTASTPPHPYNDFKLKVYAPHGFKYLRRKFNLDEVDFMSSIGETELKEISNPGASGSVFYKTSNDKYILKTVQYQEAEFLKTLLAGFAFNLLQNLINNKYSLLPTIYGLYCYQKLELTSMLSDKTNIRIVIMNNILPSDIPIHEKYDLKGSLYKRKASRQERSKAQPTFKDLDFLEEHPDGIILDERHYENIIQSIRRDCLILKSFGIMDYSLLLGIHNLEKEKNNSAIEAYFDAKLSDPPPTNNAEHVPFTSTHPGLTPINKQVTKLDKVFNITAVPARSGKGDRLLLYLGIIDILQSYRLKKRLEHTFKSMITDGSQISVCHPSFYENRFIEFVTQKVFKKATLKSSPVRKRLTFKEISKRDELSSPEQQVQSNSSSKSPAVTPVSLSIPFEGQPQQQQHQNSGSFTQQNLKNIKNIDSVDSMSAILTSSDSKQNILSPNRQTAKTGSARSFRFNDIHEGDGDSMKQEMRRAPITPIIEHYTNKTATIIHSNRNSLKKNLLTDNNDTTFVNSNNDTNPKSAGNYATDNDNDFIHNLRPLTTDLNAIKPVQLTNWNQSPLLTQLSKTGNSNEGTKKFNAEPLESDFKQSPAFKIKTIKITTLSRKSSTGNRLAQQDVEYTEQVTTNKNSLNSTLFKNTNNNIIPISSLSSSVSSSVFSTVSSQYA